MELTDYRFPDCQVLRPSFDVAFKAMFSRNKDLTRDLLMCALHFKDEIEDIAFINTELSPDMDGAKSCRLDVAVRLADGTLVDVEVQIKRDGNMKRRSVAYAAKLLSSQTEAGTKSPQPDVIALILLNHEMFPEHPKAWHRSFELRDHEGSFLEERVFRIDFVELPKAKRLHAQGDSLFSKWVEFFTAQSYAELKALCEHDEILRRARESLEMVSKDKQIWSDARAKWEGEFAFTQRELHVAKEAKAEGKAEGKAEVLKQAAQGMLEAGISRELICRSLNLTESQLAELLSERAKP